MSINQKAWTTPLDVIAGDVPHVWTALLTTPGTQLHLATTSDPGSNRLVSAAVTFDRNRTPRGTVTLTAAGIDPAELAAFDPMGDVSLHVLYGYAPADVHSFTSWKVDRITQDETGQVVITGATVDSQVLDLGQLDTPYDEVAAAARHVQALFALGGVGIAVPTYDPDNGYRLTTDAPWDSITEIMSANGWHLDSSFDVRPDNYWQPSVAELRTGPGGTITHRTIDRARDASATYVRSVHTWRDEDGIEHVVTGYAIDAARDELGNRCAATLTSSAPTTQAIANREARRALERMTARATRYTVEMIGHYWIMPDDPLELEDDTGAMVHVFVDDVTHASDGTTTLTARPGPDWFIGQVFTPSVGYSTIAAVTAAYATIADLTANHHI